MHAASDPQFTGTVATSPDRPSGGPFPNVSNATTPRDDTSCVSASSSHGVSCRTRRVFTSMVNTAVLNGSLRVRMKVIVRPSGRKRARESS